MIKKIEAWECSDGTLHKTEGGANLNECELQINRAIGVWVGRYLEPSMSTGDIAKVMMEYGGALKHSLDGIEEALV